VTRLALLTPLRQRDFALLWTGMTISLLGDGIFLVATAWQVYDLSGSPASLSLVGLSWSLGLVAFLLVGGVAADRFDRRRVMIAADAVRGAAIAAMGVLAVSDLIEVWQLALLAFVYGSAEAFFTPSFTSLIPQLVDSDDLVQANSLQEVVRPLAIRLAGPAVGGVLVGAFGAGTAFLVDAATFVVGIGCVAAIRPRALPVRAARERVRDELREGLAFVRTQPWLWATLLMAAISVLAFAGPVEVLLPYVVRHDLHSSASAYGAVLAVAGVGSVLGGLVMGQRGMPRRPVLVLYVAWGVSLYPIAGYALAVAVWQLALLAFGFGVGLAVGSVIWSTLMQTRVPPALMGRVTSLDWVVSLGLTPVSFAMCGPLAALLGTDTTLALAGIVGGTATLAIYALIPALHERGDVVGEAGVADVGGVHADDLDPTTRG
jgi:MFS family permease